ncbi:Down syndrome cell adhesion molecule Dscam2, partial [Paramuricea clavata]
INDIYDYEKDIGFESVDMKNLQDNGGDLQLTLVLSFTEVGWQNGFGLFRSFNENRFLNRTPEVKDCESKFQSCHDIVLDEVFPSGNPNRADAYFYPVAEDIEDTYYEGYNIIAYLIDGTREDVWIGHAKPTTTDRAHGTVHCGPYKLVAITVQLRTFKGAGFPCSNFMLVHTIEGAPSEGPKNLRVVSLSAFNVTVVWGNITEGKRNGIIQNYKVTKLPHTLLTF